MGQSTAAIAGTKWTRTLVGFGQELRNERERLGVPLEALAEATKVPVRNLRALESDHWAELPGGVFTKGIVRGYCKFLGLPEHQWMDRLAVSWEEAAAEQDWTEFAQAVKRNRVQTSPVMRRRWWGVAGMLLALLVLAWAAWHYVLRDRLSSNFDFYERLHLQLRAEAYNMFNHTNPDGVTSGSIVDGYNRDHGRDYLQQHHKQHHQLPG